jgi:hypothetical protein
MRLGQIALKLRLANTTFGTKIAGSAELALAMKGTLSAETAFVIPLAEATSNNDMDIGIKQELEERFGVVVALANDSSQADKLGLIAYDRLHDIRAEIWSAILGWIMAGAEYPISYGGGRILGINRAYLYYQFEFSIRSRINDEDGVEEQAVDNFDTIYAQWVLTPSANIPLKEGIPATLFTPNAVDTVDLTENPNDGAFGYGFGQGFDQYTGT